MNVHGTPYRTLWFKEESDSLHIIDQRQLPHEFVIAELQSVEQVARAIREMWVRGAPLIGATAAYGMYFAVKEAQAAPDFEQAMQGFMNQLMETRPTAVNLRWAIETQQETIQQSDSLPEKQALALQKAHQITDADVEICYQIGQHALPLLRQLHQQHPNRPLNILTHCNAGWLACVDWGTASSAIYQAHNEGIPLHVWVDETRPRNQGARLTAWELGQHGIPHTIIADNVGGHLMQHGMVDCCIVGTDRTTSTGDVANKIGTYLKALAAHDNNIPFYVALPSTTIDWRIRDGIQEIPIETRGEEEVKWMRGWHQETQTVQSIRITPADSPAVNYGFDVTPAKYVTALFTEKGVCEASEEGLKALFQERLG